MKYVRFIIIAVIAFSVTLPGLAQESEEILLDSEVAEDFFLYDEYTDPEIDYSVPLPEEFFKARVLEVLNEEPISESITSHYLQTIRVEFISGEETGKEETLTVTNISPSAAPGQRLKPGDTVVVSKMIDYEGESVYRVVDRYRLNAIIWIAVFFVALAIWLGRKRGASALVGLIFSILVLAWYIVPQILDGKNPFLIILAGSTIIAAVSLYFAHGFNKRTSIALLSTVITLSLAVIMSVVFVLFAKLFGFGSEDAYFVVIAQETINLRGLLIGGIIIGTLGVLDDITTAQTAVVAELRRANPTLTKSELYHRGLSVGHEHIAALINTLVLAYAGTSLPIFLLFTINTYQPMWTIFNSEFVAEEIIRTIVGSSALILAVPISTFLAAYFLTKPSITDKDLRGGHTHTH